MTRLPISRHDIGDKCGWPLGDEGAYLVQGAHRGQLTTAGKSHPILPMSTGFQLSGAASAPNVVCGTAATWCRFGSWRPRVAGGRLYWSPGGATATRSPPSARDSLWNGEQVRLFPSAGNEAAPFQSGGGDLRVAVSKRPSGQMASRAHKSLPLAREWCQRGDMAYRAGAQGSFRRWLDAGLRAWRALPNWWRLVGLCVAANVAEAGLVLGFDHGARPSLAPQAEPPSPRSGSSCRSWRCETVRAAS